MDTPNTNNNSQSGQSKLEQNTLMAALAYFGPLVIVSYLVSKNDSFVKFHIKQGLVLFIIEVIIAVITPMLFWSLWGVIQLLNLAILILSILGVVNAVQKKEKELPIVGDFAKHFHF